SAAWAGAPAGRVVAVSVLLAGDDGADDAAALAALCGGLPRSHFAESDRARLAAEPRPCLGTVYLDAAWFDNGRVELAATALALAALVGAEGRLPAENAPRAGTRRAAGRGGPPCKFTPPALSHA